MSELTTTKTFPANWQLGQDYNPNDHLIQLERFDKRTNRKVTSDYLNVQGRLMWFIRDQRALTVAGLAQVPYTVRTELVEMDREQGWAHFKTYLRDVLGNEATMYGSEAMRDFPDYAEKASTKSLGRALLMLGYGTPFAAELDEGERIVDAPVARQQMASNSAPRPLAATAHQEPPQRPTTAPAQPAAATTTANGETLATERQVTSIRKLYVALHRPEPDLSTLTFAAARELLTQLSHAYSESRQAS